MNSQNSQKSPLFPAYPDSPPMMEFGGWEMPRDFGGIVQEHNSVRNQVGLFDLSHMGRLIISGQSNCKRFNSLFTRNCSEASSGAALYGFFCNDQGGCIDDAIVYVRSSDEFWIVANAANRTTVVDWIQDKANVEVNDQTFETGFMAVQGPRAPDIIREIGFDNFPDNPFRSRWSDDSMVASTGYTGESGGELWLPIENAIGLFENLLELDVRPCGLGARDTLRLEQGYPLHGHELSLEIDPVTAGLEQFIDWNHDFVGHQPLQKIKRNRPDSTLIGILTGSRQSPRRGYSIREENGSQVGEITSGRYSPTLEQGIGIALIDKNIGDNPDLELNIRDRWVSVSKTELPFI